MPDSSMVCFAVEPSVAREVKRLSDPLHRLAALTAHFRRQAITGQVDQLPQSSQLLAADEVPFLQSAVDAAIERAAAKADVEMAAFIADPTVIDCVPLTEAVLDQLFPAVDEHGNPLPARRGIRPATTQDDLAATGSDRPEERLVPGGTWSPVSSTEQLVAALATAGPGSTAVLLEQGPKDIGHAWLYRNIGHDTNTGQLLIAHIDPQAPRTVEVFTGQQLARRWIRVGRGTRMIVIDSTRTAVDSAALPVQSQSASTAQALVDAPTGHGYGAVGVEAEDHHRVILFPKGHKMARVHGEYQGAKIMRLAAAGLTVHVDLHSYWLGDQDRAYHHSEDLAQAAGNKKARPVQFWIPEFVTDPIHVLPWELGVDPDTTFRNFIEIQRRLDSLQGPTLMRQIFPVDKGFTYTELGWDASIAPPLGPVPHASGLLLHFTVGVPVTGLQDMLVWVLQESFAGPQRDLVKDGLDFGLHAAARLFGRRPKAVDDLLGRPDFESTRGYLALLHTHVAARVLYPFLGKSLLKNLLAAASRNPFHSIRAALPGHVQNMLNDNRTMIDSIMRVYLERRHPDYVAGNAALLGQNPATWDVFTHPDLWGNTHHDLLDSALLHNPPKVVNSSAQTMKTYPELDTNHGRLAVPLVLLELRSLGFDGSGRTTTDQMIARYHQVETKAQELYARSVAGLPQPVGGAASRTAPSLSGTQQNTRHTVLPASGAHLAPASSSSSGHTAGRAASSSSSSRSGYPYGAWSEPEPATDAAHLTGDGSGFGASVDFAGVHDNSSTMRIARDLIIMPDAVERPVASRTEAARLISLLLQNKDVAQRVADSGVRVVIIPRTERLADVTEFTGTAASARDIPSKARGWTDTDRKRVAISEENLLGDDAQEAGRTHPEGYSSALHELAHMIWAYGLTDKQRAKVTAEFDARTAAGPDQQWVDGPLRNTAGNLVGNHSSTNPAEYFAQNVVAWFRANIGRDTTTGQNRNNEPGWIETNDPKVHQILSSLFIEPAGPLNANALSVTRQDNALLDALRDHTALTEQPPLDTASDRTAPNRIGALDAGTDLQHRVDQELAKERETKREAHPGNQETDTAERHLSHDEVAEERQETPLSDAEREPSQSVILADTDPLSNPARYNDPHAGVATASAERHRTETHLAVTGQEAADVSATAVSGQHGAAVSEPSGLTVVDRAGLLHVQSLWDSGENRDELLLALRLGEMAAAQAFGHMPILIEEAADKISFADRPLAWQAAAISAAHFLDNGVSDEARAHVLRVTQRLAAGPDHVAAQVRETLGPDGEEHQRIAVVHTTDQGRSTTPSRTGIGGETAAVADQPRQSADGPVPWEGARNERSDEDDQIAKATASGASSAMALHDELGPNGRSAEELHEAQEGEQESVRVPSAATPGSENVTEEPISGLKTTNGWNSQSTGERSAEALSPDDHVSRPATEVFAQPSALKMVAFLDAPRNAPPMESPVAESAIKAPLTVTETGADSSVITDSGTVEDINPRTSEREPSNADRLAALRAALRPDLFHSIRPWEGSMDEETTRLSNSILEKGGSRSIVFGDSDEEPVWVIKMQNSNSLSWFDRHLMPLPEGPHFAHGPVASIDISQAGQLTGPSLLALKDLDGKTIEETKLAYCDTSFGYDFANFFTKPVQW
ncbi:hypothetical protein [Streptomyces sp. NPDC014676]|uniref:hypothetical protein n=1 Tax=Streptomyces sp. NPDC014676 TaxID=3364879 RepID=UPI0036FE5786